MFQSQGLCGSSLVLDLLFYSMKSRTNLNMDEIFGFDVHEVETRDLVSMRDDAARLHAEHMNSSGEGVSRRRLEARHVHIVL